MLDVGRRGGERADGGRGERAPAGDEQQHSGDPATDLEAERANVVVGDEISGEMQRESQRDRSPSRPHDRTADSPCGHVERDDHGSESGRIWSTMELIHTCYRIGDIDRSVAFYEALGFEELRRLPIRDEAINVFMGLPGDGPRLELTHNFGVESYELGTGYGHIAVSVDDLDTTLERLNEQGIEPERTPYTVREGGSRLCFVRDPDGYRIELIESGS